MRRTHLLILLLFVILATVLGYYLVWRKSNSILTRFEEINKGLDSLSRSRPLPDTLLEGDIIFQSSMSGQSRAIQLATGSPYSHCGVLFMRDGRLQVLEAVQPVKYTSLDEWIKRGDDHHYLVTRLKNRDSLLTATVLDSMKKTGELFLGKDYDLHFSWSDEKLYCSELVWKLYKRCAGLESGTLQQLSEFDLSHPEVKKKLKERYGNNLPLNEPVISPASLLGSHYFEIVRLQ